MATFRDDLHAALHGAIQAGMVTANQARFGNLSFAFVDTRVQLIWRAFTQ